MKLEIKRGELLNALNICSKATGKAIIPALDNFKLKTIGQKLYITTSTMEIFISAEIDCNVESDIDILVNYSKFHSLVRSLNDDIITIVVGEKTITIKSKNGKYTMPFENGSDFPEVPSPIGNTIELNSTEIINAIDRSILASIKDEDSRGMSNILFDFSEKGLTIAGASPQMLTNNKVSDCAFIDIKLHIPNNSLSVILPLIADKELIVNSNEKNVSFKFDNVFISLALKNSTFPNYMAVIPTEQPFVCEVNKALLVSAIKRVSILANKMVDVIKLSFSENELTISAKNTLLNEEASEKLDCKYSGELVEVWLNHVQVLAILQRFYCDTVFLRFEDHKRVVAFRDNDSNSIDEVIINSPCVI